MPSSRFRCLQLLFIVALIMFLTLTMGPTQEKPRFQNSRGHVTPHEMRTREKVCSKASAYANATGTPLTTAFRKLWNCPSTICCELSPTPLPTHGVMHVDEQGATHSTKQKKTDSEQYPSPTPGPTRLAIIQAGLLNSWFENETIQHVVKPMAARGWIVDVYIELQNYTGNKTVRYRSAHDRTPRHQNMTQEQLTTTFTNMVEEVGGNVIFFNIIPDLQSTGIITSFNWDHLTHRLTNHDTSRKANPVRQFMASWGLYEKVMTHERSSRHLYTWVLRLREDAGWLIQPAFELADPNIAYFRYLTGVGGTTDKAFLLPGKHAMSILHNMAFGIFTIMYWHKLANPEHLLDIGLIDLYFVPNKMPRGKVNKDKKMTEFALCVADLIDSIEEGVCFRRDYIGLPVTWPQGLDEEGGDLLHKSCRA